MSVGVILALSLTQNFVKRMKQNPVSQAAATATFLTPRPEMKKSCILYYYIYVSTKKRFNIYDVFFFKTFLPDP